MEDYTTYSHKQLAEAATALRHEKFAGVSTEREAEINAALEAIDEAARARPQHIVGRVKI